MVPGDESRESRAARYRATAKESEQLAEKSKSEKTRQAYLKLASEWRELADELEKGPSTEEG